MPRKKKEPIEPIPDSHEVRETKATINALLSQVIKLATGTADRGSDLTMSDQRRVLSWLSAQMTFASNSHKQADGPPFVQELARHRYASIASGLRAGLTMERVAAEAGVSPSAVVQVQIRHQEVFDLDPQRREAAKQRRISAARRAADRKKTAQTAKVVDPHP